MKEIYESFHSKTKVQHRVIRYDNFTYKAVIATINRYLIPSKRLLDIGCGAGTISLFAANKGCIVTGIDISSRSIEAAKESAAKLNINNIKFTKMVFPKEFPKDKYDIIICLEVLEHLADDRAALGKMFSLLKHNGIIILSTPSLNAPLYRLGLLKRFDLRVGHLRRYLSNDLTVLMESIGFNIIEVKKTEGILRNFLFTNRLAGKSLRFVKSFVSTIVTYIDHVLVEIFGESDIIVVARKV